MGQWIRWWKVGTVLGIAQFAIVSVAGIVLSARSYAGVTYRVEPLFGIAVDASNSIFPRSVNDAGVVAGDTPLVVTDHDVPYGPARWEPGSSVPTQLDLLKNPYAIGAGINNAGTMVGHVMSQVGVERPVMWKKDGTALTELPTFTTSAFEDLRPSAINDRGDIVGTGLATFAVRWPAGATKPVALGVLGLKNNTTTVTLNGINSGGDAVGSALDYLHSTGIQTAAFWPGSGTAAIALPGLPKDPGVQKEETIANAINDSGTIVGAANFYVNFQINSTHAVRWSPGGTSIIDLGIGSANAINNQGDVVGSAINVGVSIWPSDNSGPLSLNDSIPADSGWRLLTASDISDTGVIIGQGYYDPDGPGPIERRTLGYRLTPIPEPGALMMLASGVFLLRRRRLKSL